MTDLILSALLLAGSIFVLLASIGILRLPDLPTRMHASTKAGSLGAMLLLTAVAIYFGDGVVTTRAVAIILFILITAPIAAHAIGRAAYFAGVPLWENTLKDELKQNYNPANHSLASSQPNSASEVTDPKSAGDCKP